MDESPKQLIRETREPVAMKPGLDRKVDYDGVARRYARCGVCNIFMANEPLKGKRQVKVTDTKTKKDWVEFIKEIAEVHYPKAERITLVMDNFGTHTPGAVYEVLPPLQAKNLLNRFEFIYTPKHGSCGSPPGLNMAEIELNVLMGQCLSRRIDKFEIVEKEVHAWQKHRNNQNSKIEWRFTTKEARIKLKKLYPSIHT